MVFTSAFVSFTIKMLQDKDDASLCDPYIIYEHRKYGLIHTERGNPILPGYVIVAASSSPSHVVQ